MTADATDSADATEPTDLLAADPPPAELQPVEPADEAAVAAQLGRAPRALRAVAHRCPCGLPSVVQTAPRLDDGTPFPTLYYLTCARLCSRIGGLEADGRMREMTDRLADGPALVRCGNGR